MKVAELMTPHVVTVLEDSNFTEAVRLMLNMNIHHLPVVNKKKEMVGMMSSHDALVAYNEKIYSRLITNESEMNDLIKIGDIMSSDKLMTLQPTQCAKKAVTIFKDKNCHAIPVVIDKSLVGILTSQDILDHLKDELCPCSKIK